MESVVHFIAEIPNYIVGVFMVIWFSLLLRPGVFDYIATHTDSWGLSFGVAFVAGVSTLIGNSASLFVNRVRPIRFLAALIVNGVTLIATWLIWALTLWLMALVVFKINANPFTALRLILLGAAPLSLGFLVLAPYLGPAVSLVLEVWSLLIVIVMAHYETQQPLWVVIAIVILGWLVVVGVSRTIGQPVLGIGNRLWADITGIRDQVTTEDLMIAYMRGDIVTDTKRGGSL